MLIVADQAPVRGDGLDHRYTVAACGRTAVRLFGVEATWCPQDPEIRAALVAQAPDVVLTPWNLPAVIDTSRWAARRGGASREHPVVGTDLCDQGVWPRDDAGGARRPRRAGRGRTCGCGCRTGRVRTRSWAARAPTWSTRPSTWTRARSSTSSTSTCTSRTRDAVETFSRPALEAAAQGCVVVMPERHAAVFGDAAVYCGPGEVAALIKRYAADRPLFAEQSRRARAVVAKAHHPQLYVDRDRRPGARAAAPGRTRPSAHPPRFRA